MTLERRRSPRILPADELSISLNKRGTASLVNLSRDGAAIHFEGPMPEAGSLIELHVDLRSTLVFRVLMIVQRVRQPIIGATLFAMNADSQLLWQRLVAECQGPLSLRPPGVPRSTSRRR